MRDLDILVLGDLRFPGGTSVAKAEELAASAAAGYRCGLINLRAPVLRYPHPINPRIRALIDNGTVELLDPREPVNAKLACLYHPQAATNYPLCAPRFTADVKLLIVNHPPHDAAGQPFYDWTAANENAQALMGGAVYWAPVGPAVRRQLEGLAEPPPLLDTDWQGVINPEQWAIDRREGPRPSPILGRHSRPDPSKWPDDRETLLQIYPDDPEFVVRILGDGSFLRELAAPYPPNWQVWAFNARSPRDFLAQIDYFVYFHHSRWVEAFGFTILEAMASGAPPILPHHFRPLFGDAATYAKPREVRDVIRTLHDNPALRQERSTAAVDEVHSRFSHAVHQSRIKALIGAPRKSSRPTPRGKRRALFISSNGVGMGHLTRLLAIARRCSPEIEPIFITMSRAAGLVADFGFPVEFIPYHGYLKCSMADWNHHLRRDISERLAFYRPDVVVFDGNVPYSGLLNALRSMPECPTVWCRRAMWTPNSGKDHVVRERAFDVVLEPREIAAAYDQGLTTKYRGRTRQVDPIQLLDPADLLAKEAAREALGFEMGKPAALVQLGSGNNYDLSEIRQLILQACRAIADLQVVWLDSAIADNALDLPEWVQRIKGYPIAKHFNAFDFVISAAGYNSFHELVLNGVPTVFVPNEHPMMDDQLARATYAEVHGLALRLRANERYRVMETVQRISDPAEQELLRERCAGLDADNGAYEAAQLLEELVYTARADLDAPAVVIPALRNTLDR